MKDRKSKLISKNKLLNAVNLFESKIDKTIEEIKIYSSNHYLIITKGKDYNVDLTTNTVDICYPDPDWD